MNEKKVKGKKININKNVVNKTDEELERDAIQEENFSILMIIIIIFLCFVVGVSLGYILYRIAINSSSAIILSCLF